jgi:hypothetical protein
MKTKMNEMNKKAIKFINSIALTLVLSMTVFVACQKEAGIGPNNTPAANSGVANKEVAFNPGIYDQAAGDPLFTAYYEALMQFKAPLYNKITKEGAMEQNKKLMASINDALENNNLAQAVVLMGYESLECFMAKSATLNLATSKFLEKYPSISPEFPGEHEKVYSKYIETYHNTPNGSMLRDAEWLDWFKCGGHCHTWNQVPDEACCSEVYGNYVVAQVKIGGALAIALVACAKEILPIAVGKCQTLALAAAALESGTLVGETMVAASHCCKDKGGE